MMIQTEDVSCDGCGGADHEVLVTTRDFGFETCENSFVYVRCATCGLIYLLNRPAPRELNAIYPSEYVAYKPSSGSILQAIRDRDQMRKYRRLLQHIRPDDSILDYGCGSGELLRVIKRRGGHAGHLFGSDFSKDAADALAQHELEYLPPDLEAMPFEGSLGALVMNQVIEHLAQPQQVIQTARRMLRPGGVFYIETPSPAGWDYSVFDRRYWGGWHAPRHFFVFEEATLTTLLERGGFEVLSVEYFMSPFLWNETIKARLAQRRWSRSISRFFTIRNVLSLPIVGLIDAVQLAMRKKSSNIRIVARKTSST